MNSGLIVVGFHGSFVDLGGIVIVVVLVAGSVLGTWGWTNRALMWSRWRVAPSPVCIVVVGLSRVAGLVIVQEVIIAESLLLLLSVLDVLPAAAVVVLVIVEVLVVVSQGSKLGAATE